MKVIAKKGTICPLEGFGTGVITDSRPVEVPETSYYRRRIFDGSLTRVDENAAPVKSPENKGDKK